MRISAPSRRAVLIIAVAVFLLSGYHPGLADAGAMSAKAQALARFLDRQDVETKWIAGARIDWETGLPTGKPETRDGKHTHCSAFVASAAKQLGVYVLRPPEHGQRLLANAQYDWLSSDAGRRQGWRPVDSAVEAQTAANQGLLVVAVYRNHHDDRPGHIAIIRPSDQTAETLAAEGPAIIQAGGTNYTETSLKTGFAGHPAAWRLGEVKYFAHTIDGPLP